jgi:hypothetical protein
MAQAFLAVCNNREFRTMVKARAINYSLSFVKVFYTYIICADVLTIKRKGDLK